MKTFSTAHKELLGKLQQDKAALRMKVKANNTDIKKWEKTEGEKVRSCGKLLIEAVTHLSNLALKSVQSSVSGRMVALKTSESSMEAAQNEKDTFRFLQKYSQVHQDVEKAKAVDLRYGLEPSADREALIQQLRQGGQSMLTQGNHFLRALLTLVDPESHQNLDGPYSNLAFQPMSSGTISGCCSTAAMLVGGMCPTAAMLVNSLSLYKLPVIICSLLASSTSGGSISPKTVTGPLAYVTKSI